MENFTWFDGKEFNFWTCTGEVISSNKTSETHIMSSGGGGHVDPQYGGHVAAAQISSKVITVHEFWFREENGNEVAVNMRDVNIPLAVGQKITLLLSGLVNEKSGYSYYVVLYNHSAKKHWLMLNGLGLYHKACEPEVKMFVMNAKFLAVFAGLLLIWYYISGYISLALIVWGIYYLITQSLKVQKSAKALDAKFEQWAEKIAGAEAI